MSRRVTDILSLSDRTEMISRDYYSEACPLWYEHQSVSEFLKYQANYWKSNCFIDKLLLAFMLYV